MHARTNAHTYINCSAHTIQMHHECNDDDDDEMAAQIGFKSFAFPYNNLICQLRY